MKAFKDDESPLFIMKRQPKDDAPYEPAPLPRFRRIEGAFGWLDPQPRYYMHGGTNWFACIGEMENGVYFLLEEHSGRLADLGKVAVDAKDRYFIRRIHVERGDGKNVESLEDPKLYDGLCTYGNNGEATYGSGILQYWHSYDYWPNYRDRFTKATLIPVPEELTNTFGIAQCYEIMQRLGREGRWQIRQGCTVAIQLFEKKPPLEDVFQHPLLKAIVWTLAMMEESAWKSGGDQEKQPKPWYGNLVR